MSIKSHITYLLDDSRKASNLLKFGALNQTNVWVSQNVLKSLWTWSPLLFSVESQGGGALYFFWVLFYKKGKGESADLNYYKMRSVQTRRVEQEPHGEVWAVVFV
jgi:hypothetical protein